MQTKIVSSTVRRCLSRLGAIYELTPTERLVAEHLVGGAANKDIAAALGSTYRTVEAQVSSILVKTGCATRLELAVKFWQRVARAASRPRSLTACACRLHGDRANEWQAGSGA